MIKKWELLALSCVVLGTLAFLSFPIMGGDIFLSKGENVTIMVNARASEMGGFEPDEIVVNQGESVKLLIYAEDVVHGIAISGYDINAKLYPGKWVEIEFTAEKAGTFPFFCTIYCSPTHGLMMGRLIVVPTS